MKGSANKTSRLLAVTLMELMIVVLIISILASIATGVYTGKAQEARVAAAHALIHNLAIAITRYEIDTGSLPPSGSGVVGTAVDGRNNGSGMLHLALVHDVTTGTAVSPLWKGPYINLQAEQLQPQAGDLVTPGMIDIVDPWGLPIIYVASADYDKTSSGKFWGGTLMFESAPPPNGTNPKLPAPNPFFAREKYYNPKTFQLVSFGPDGVSRNTPLNSGSLNYAGTEADDINNFGY